MPRGKRRREANTPSAKTIAHSPGSIHTFCHANCAITSVSIADKTLVLGYSFTYEGNAVDAVVSLTPAAEGKTTAQIDFAGGAYVMTGTAAKKEKAK